MPLNDSTATFPSAYRFSLILILTAFAGRPLAPNAGIKTSPETDAL
jgi:hypothetical protein